MVMRPSASGVRMKVLVSRMVTYADSVASTMPLFTGAKLKTSRFVPAGMITLLVPGINAGVNAWSFQQMLVFYRDVAAAWQPDFVLVGEGNLWTQFSEQNSPEFAEKFMSRVRLKNFLRHFALYHYIVEVKLNDFYARHRTKFIPVDPKQDTLFKEQQQRDPNAAFREAIEGICHVARTNGATPILLFLPRLDELSPTNEVPIRAIKQEIAVRLGVTFVDVTAEIVTRGKALYLDADPVHFNAEGNAIIARKIVTNLGLVP